MNAKANRKGKFKRNSAAEEARIQAGIKADPDTRELTAKDFAEMIPFREMMKRRGRPKAAVHKRHVNLRLDLEIVEFFQRGGRGWQTRVNAALRAYMKRSSSRQTHG